MVVTTCRDVEEISAIEPLACDLWARLKRSAEHGDVDKSKGERSTGKETKKSEGLELEKSRVRINCHMFEKNHQHVLMM